MSFSNQLADLSDPPGVRNGNKPKAGGSSTSRLPPHSTEAERGVLACIFQDSEESLPLVSARISDVDFFYELRHRTIYTAIVELADAGKPIDLVILRQRLQDRGQLEKTGGVQYLAALPDAAPSVAVLSSYLDILVEQAILRRVIRVCSAAAAAAYDQPDNVDEALDDIERDVLAIGMERAGKAEQSMEALVKKAYATIEEWENSNGAPTGISTGFQDLDQLTRGLHRGEMIVIAARPGMGKTSLAINIAEHVAMKEKKPVGVFSLEMTAESIALRMLCSRAKVNMHEARGGILSPESHNNITDSASDMMKSPLFIDDAAGLDILGLRSRARRMAQQHKVELLIIDYIQLLRSSSRRAENRQQEIADISSGIKSLAKELDVPVVALSQLNREVEARQGKPRLSDLRESGAIEQDADFVGLLYIPSEAEDDVAAGKDSHAVHLLVAKQRNGPTGDIPLTFLKGFTRFENAARVSEEDIHPTGTN